MSDPFSPQASSLPTRTGAHRVRRGPFRDALPTVAVLLAVVLIGLGAWALTRSTASSIQSSGTDDTGSQSQGTAPTGPTTGSTAATTSPTSTRSPGTPTSGTSSSSTTSSPPAGAVDRSTPVTVLNATRTSGLAASLAATLRSSGWQVPTTDNYRRSQPPTTVFYASADQRATASAVADDMGGDPKVAQSSEFGPDRITVVIGPDYAG
jgi:cytoskeletal protein RodZ